MRLHLRPFAFALVTWLWAMPAPTWVHAEAEKVPDVSCEGHWSLKVKVIGGRRHCRKGKPFSTVIDVLVADGRYVSRMRPSMERTYVLEVVPQGRTCTLKWHDELVTTVASPYDLLTTDYELEATDGAITGTGHRSEETVGSEPHCAEELRVTGALRRFLKRDRQLSMRRVRRDLAEFLKLVPDFCRSEDVPSLTGPLAIELTISADGGAKEISINGESLWPVASCTRLLASNLLDLFPNPTGVEQKVKLQVGGEPKSPDAQ